MKKQDQPTEVYQRRDIRPGRPPELYTLPPMPAQNAPPPLAPQPRRQRRGCGCFLKLASLVILLLAFLIFAGAGAAGSVVYGQLAGEIEDGIARLDNAGERETFETTIIMDRDGEVLWEIFGEGKRTHVPLEQIPAEVIQATIAIEDDTFYENIGLDAPSLVGALVANLRNPDDRPVGGSTITQQIVRHIAFDYDERTTVSYERKVKEIILARLMTEKYSKDDILELYLNEIYYGNLAYGIEAAAQTYFGKTATDLTLAEASLLAALPQSPVELDPFTNLEGAKERQWIVLNLMAEEGFIPRDLVEPTYFAPLTFAPQEVSLEAPHFAVYVRQQLEEQFGTEVVANGGLRVTTTLDMDYQRLAESLARQHVAEVGAEHNLTNTALVAIKPGTGEIIAMLGSVDYRAEDIDGNVNIALSPQQPGSAIKPLTYAAALSPLAETGTPDIGAPAWTAADILWDVPVDYPQFDGSVYSPVNYDHTFHGPLRLRDALANSYNIPAVLVLQDTGLPRFLEFAGKLGVESFVADAGQYGLSITLGGAELTPLELTAAYSVFANGGQRIPPVSILSVEKANGEILYAYTPPAGEQVVDPRVAFLISDILDDDAARVPAMGNNNPLDLPFPAAAKTGTTNDFRDNWTLGYTPGLAVGVWTGNTDNSEMIDVSGLTGAAPLWSAYMQAVYSDPALQTTLLRDGVPPPAGFAAPAGMEQRSICDISSVTVGAAECLLNDQEWFLLAGAPSAPTPIPAEPVVLWEELDPGVVRLPAVPLERLPEDIQIVDPERLNDPQPTACFFPAGTPVSQLPETAITGVFLAAPRNPESIAAAHQWAEEHNLAIMPPVACSDELMAAARPERDPRTNAVWRLSTPGNGETVSGVISVLGTADFDPGQVQFYKVEIGKGARPEEWITIGETHNEPVVNGFLENLVAAAFEPGTYSLRLVLVRWDGNYVGEPDTVTFEIE